VLQLNRINFAAADPDRLGEFWAALVDGGAGPELFFRKAEKSPTIELPMHLDVNVPDREAELQRILELGGKLVETKSHSVGDLAETWTVMRDPEGNGFCIQSPPNTTSRMIGNVTFSAAEPRRLGPFWAEALAWPEEVIDEAFVQTLLDAGVDPEERNSFYVARETPTSRPRLLFQRRERSRPASYPIHLDLRADDREAEVERLRALGATVSEVKATHTVMRDPESNPFCIE
jgi:predicted enzyme related to lactoylglutathione lyase